MKPILRQIKTLLEQADLVCFAGTARSDPTICAQILSQAQDLIAHLEKSLK